MHSGVIYHVCTAEAWRLAEAEGDYRGSADDRRDGYIHFSTRDQVVESVARHRAGQHGLVLLDVAADRLGADLKWEESRRGQLFPHLYAPLPLAAVRRVRLLPLGPGNLHVFPPLD
jgi:uncharacterized protein (DUF952 family)